MNNSPITRKLRIDPSVAEQTAEIFVLNIDCMENIFDYLELRDVCAIGMTCRQIQQVAGKYFQRFYPMHRIIIGRNEQGGIVEKMANESDVHLTNFGRFTEDLEVVDNDIEVLRYAVEIMSNSLKSISLRDFKKYLPIHDEYVAKLVQNVECITFADSCQYFDHARGQNCANKYGDDSICYDDILKHCESIRCLKFECNYNFNVREKYPHLEHLTIKHPFEDVYSNYDFDMSKLKNFLQQNLHIKKVSIIGKMPAVTALLELFKDFDIKLDDLSVVYDDFGDPDGYDHDIEIYSYCNSLDYLSDHCKYKELKLRFHYTDFYSYGFDMKNTSEITKMEIEFDDKEKMLDFIKYKEYEDHQEDFENFGAFKIENEISDEEFLKRNSKHVLILPDLKCLHLNGFIYLIDAAFFMEELKKLECLRLDGNIESGVLDIFAFNSPTLKEIIYISNSFVLSELKLATINNNRKYLRNSQKLKIYLPEKDFLQLKWKTTQLKYKYVEVKCLND